MTASITSTADFQGLAQLRSDAAVRSPEAAREAARQFEALFVQMMLKSMREASAVLGEERDTTYEEMFDREISLELTKGQGLGLAGIMTSQLGGEEPRGPADAGSALTPGPPATSYSLPVLRSRLAALTDPAAAGVPGRTEASATVTGARSDFRPASREEFVREIWPLAVRAGQQLGVDPRAIVAQAALETGWGSRQIRDEAGISGNNLFGIKADSRWSGPRVTVSTLEYEGGVPVPQQARFRAYPDLAAGFADYVEFLRANPRYSEALRSGSDAEAWGEGLQSAGYATDPRYAEKLRRILQSPILGGTPPALKTGGDLPT